MGSSFSMLKHPDTVELMARFIVYQELIDGTIRALRYRSRIKFYAKTLAWATNNLYYKEEKPPSYLLSYTEHSDDKIVPVFENYLLKEPDMINVNNYLIDNTVFWKNNLSLNDRKKWFVLQMGPRYALQSVMRMLREYGYKYFRRKGIPYSELKYLTQTYSKLGFNTS